jgi:hypothetical protein
MKYILISAAVVLASTSITFAAKPLEVTLRDCTGTAWSDELVHYAVELPAGAVKGEAVARVEARGGKAVPSQVSDVTRHPDGSVRAMNVWFFTDLGPSQTVSYVVTPGKEGPAGAGVRVKTDAAAVELTTLAPQRIGIRLPAGGTSFDWPVPATNVPGPVQALLLPSGRATGRGRWDVPFRVNSWKTEVTAAGPLFAEARVTYAFDTGYWTFKARVIRGCPMIVIEEELNNGYSGLKARQFDRYFSLRLDGEGFRPTQVFLAGRNDRDELQDVLKLTDPDVPEVRANWIASPVSGFAPTYKEV